MSITISKNIFATLDAALQATILAAINDSQAKPKRVLSDEQKAKMKAGREAAAAKKKLETPTEEVASDSGSSEKKRGPKKLTDMTPEERTAHNEKVAARKATKAAKAAKSSETTPVESETEVPAAMATPEKPKRVLSEEQKAKMKAGREAAAAKKKAEKEETSRSPSPKLKDD